MKAYTDLEQSKKLAEILPIESADMYYKYILPKSDKIHHIPEIGNSINSLKWYNEGYTFSGRKEPITLNEYCIPAWSTEALMKLLPAEFTSVGEYSTTTYEIDIRKYKLTEDVDLYQIAYGSRSFIDGIEHWKDMINTREKENLIDCAFQMICLLKKYNYL